MLLTGWGTDSGWSTGSVFAPCAKKEAFKLSQYALRPGLRVYKDSDGDLRTFSPALGEVKTFRGFEGDFMLMQALQESRNLMQVQSFLQSHDIDVSEEELEQVLNAFLTHGVIEIVGQSEREVNALEAFFREFDTEKAEQIADRLRESTVIIIGIGTVGSALSILLSQVGIGRLIIVDEDVVENKNLRSQLPYSRKRVGDKKVDALADFIRARTEIEVVLEDKQIKSADHLVHILNQYIDPNMSDLTFIVNCADEPNVDMVATWIEIAVKKTNMQIPFIAGGGYAGHLGSIGPTIIPGKSVCWSCYMEQVQSVRSSTIDHWKMVASRSLDSYARPVFSPLGMFISSLLAQEVVWVITRLNKPLFINRHAEWSIRKGEFVWKPIRKQPSCNCC